MKLMRKYFLPLFILITVCTFSDTVKSQDSMATGYTAQRMVPDSVADEMRNDPDFAYANDSSYWEKEETSEPGLLSRLVQALARSAFLKIIFYIVVAVLVIFIVYKVVVANNFFVPSKRRRKRSGAEAGAEADEWENLDAKVDEAIIAGNYRGAVRYMYLKTLKFLSENDLITLHSKSTNQEYVQQMYKHSDGVQFRQLTRIYEYVWYGEFIPTETQFEKIRTNFNHFNPIS